MLTFFNIKINIIIYLIYYNCKLKMVKMVFLEKLKIDEKYYIGVLNNQG